MLYSWVQAGRRGVVLGLLALAFAASSAFAQTGRIEGTVRSATTGDALANAQVSVVGRRLSATTDARGFYRVSDVPPGTYTLRAALVGYSPVSVTNVAVSAGLPATADTRVSAAGGLLEEGVVTGTGSYVGGLIGSSYGTVSNSYWDAQTSGIATSAGGIGSGTGSDLKRPSAS